MHLGKCHDLVPGVIVSVDRDTFSRIFEHRSQVRNLLLLDRSWNKPVIGWSLLRGQRGPPGSEIFQADVVRLVWLPSAIIYSQHVHIILAHKKGHAVSGRAQTCPHTLLVRIFGDDAIIDDRITPVSFNKDVRNAIDLTDIDHLERHKGSSGDAYELVL